VTKRLGIVGLVLLALVTAACGGGGDGDEGQGMLDGDTKPDGELFGNPSTTEGRTNRAGETLAIKASDFTFDVATKIGGGTLTIELDNTAGKEAHEAALFKLDSGKTPTDYQRWLATPQGPPPGKDAGGPGAVLPGKTATYVGNVEAGTYVFACYIPSPTDGLPHWIKGMMTQVTIENGPTKALPAASATITATSREFAGTEGLKAGGQTVRVQNSDTAEPHNWSLVSLQSGKTAQDVVAFFASSTGGPPPGPPPFTGLPGLVGAIQPGQSATRTLELERGSYAFVCVVRDSNGRPHFADGMVKEFTIA
jgi:uncharacterized cupredoxin-like copper-binding protein